LAANLEAFGNGPPDLDDNPDEDLNDDTDDGPDDAVPTTTTAAPPPPPAMTTDPPPPAADVCSDSYKFILDHFDIHGRNFDPTKFGTDGSGLKQQIQGR
jgi:hypothetical protein